MSKVLTLKDQEYALTVAKASAIVWLRKLTLGTAHTASYLRSYNRVNEITVELMKEKS